MHSWGFALREGVFAENKEGIDQGKKLIFRSPFPILSELKGTFVVPFSCTKSVH